MKFLNAVLLTFLFVFALEVAAYWIDLASYWQWDYDLLYPLIQGGIQLIVVMLLVLFFDRTTFQLVGEKITFSWAGLAFLMGLCSVFVQTPLNSIYNGIFQCYYWVNYDFDDLQFITNINGLVLFLFVPLGEELFFRGLIQERLLKGVEATKAILVTAILFALIHSPYEMLFFDFEGNWHQTYITFFGGIILGILARQSQSLWPAIICHCTLNLFVIIV